MSNKTQDEGCTLSDQELSDSCREWISKLCKSGGREWMLSIPVSFNRDPDMLFSELITRFKSATEENEELRAKIRFLEELEPAASKVQKLSESGLSRLMKISDVLEKIKDAPDNKFNSRHWLGVVYQDLGSIIRYEIKKCEETTTQADSVPDNLQEAMKLIDQMVSRFEQAAKGYIKGEFLIAKGKEVMKKWESSIQAYKEKGEQ
jgi:DNA repair ATPase RecN